jgi:hypothetical protein
MSTGEGNLLQNTREGYIDYPKAQRLLGELRKGKAFKEVKLVDGLFKYKKTWVYVLRRKLRILIVKEKYHTIIAGHK